jgi:CBS domain-containing protein
MAVVCEVMSKRPISVAPSTPIPKVARKMGDCATSIVPVCDNGRYRGIVTDREIIRHVGAASQNPKREQAKDLMKKDGPVVSPEQHLEEAAKIMASNGVQALPVTRNGKLVGLFTLDDLARESLALAAMVLFKTAR